MQYISLRDELFVKHQFSRQGSAIGRVGRALTLTWFALLISDQAKLILILVLEFFFYGSVDEVGVGLSCHGGGFDSIAIFHSGSLHSSKKLSLCSGEIFPCGE